MPDINGIPYVESTDLVSAYPAASQALAQEISDQLATKLNLAGGKILQIVRATDSTNRTTTSTSVTDVTGMSITITPQKNDSAVIVVASLGFVRAEVSPAGNPSGIIYITDNSNNILSGGRAQFGSNAANTRQDNAFFWWGYSTPATTSATTYKLRFQCPVSSMTLSIFNATTTGQLYAIEVSA